MRPDIQDANSSRPTVLVLGGRASSLVNFRAPLIEELCARRYRVVAAAGEDEAAVGDELRARGIEYAPVGLNRTGTNPFSEVAMVLELNALMRRVRPAIFIGYTIKSVIYGLIAARLAGVPRRFAMITGLGYAFTEGNEIKRRLLRRISGSLYRTALKFADRVLFQNPDDRDYFVGKGFVMAEKTALVNGSGVDLARFVPAPLPPTPLTFLLIARLLRDKGIREYCEAARIVKNAHPEVHFLLAGPFDSNPAGIAQDELDGWTNSATIEYLGSLNDVRPALAASHVYVLPSYREGTPRTVLEAMATGRAIITTNVPGCRETVQPGVNGYLVPAKDPKALAQAMLNFLATPTLAKQMGQTSLEMVSERFESRAVAQQTADMLGLYVI
ncbi:MAG: glycosyltransferase family 4 protein [Terriglobia bacterium]|nr:glycosyltransferase family 4 protein [Terriglobia bacterium]